MQSGNDNFSVLDDPRVLAYLFHPRHEPGYRPRCEERQDMMIPVGREVQISASFHFREKQAPVLLFFHGNGEIVSDYDDIGMLFNQSGLNFFVVDYRAYGRSTGTPTVSRMMRDCHAIADFVKQFMADNHLTGPLCVMGRSLGSASAIELASKRPSDFKCLIVESGFALIGPLLETLGLKPEMIGFARGQVTENIDKIKQVTIPCLIIHARFDHIIPYSDAMDLFETCASEKKGMLEIKDANHNDIFFKGRARYLEQVGNICLAHSS